jgi:hypothetical protein
VVSARWIGCRSSGFGGFRGAPPQHASSLRRSQSDGRGRQPGSLSFGVDSLAPPG